MNSQIKLGYCLAMGIILFSSCKKDSSLESTDTTTSISTASSIAVAATSVVGASADSVYIVQTCPRGSKRDSIAEASLPASISAYLTANYPGYTFNKGFAVHNSAQTTTGYVVIIYYNDNPVGIEFDSSGSFVKVLEQREKGDLDGRGWHHGGRFGDRDRLRKDTVALNALPSSIQSYIASNYPGDTLIQAFKSRDSSYLVVSKNNGIFATLFDAGGNFIKRVQLPARSGNCQGIEQAALPANVLSYLDTTYPNYVFKKAFLITSNEVVAGYAVLIDANNTKYALQFDASGNFVKVKTVN